MESVALSQEISTKVALAYKAAFGRGPMKIVTSRTRGTVLCVLRGLQSTEHKNLLAAGEQEMVEAVHRRLQRMITPQLIQIVEDLCGRQVVAHIAGYDAHHDAATNTFLLASANDL